MRSQPYVTFCLGIKVVFYLFINRGSVRVSDLINNTQEYALQLQLLHR